MANVFTRRDVDLLKTQRELLRRASLTSPAVIVGGEDSILLRKFAEETLMLMKSLFPERFRTVNVNEWWEALKQYVGTRRPDFRADLVAKLKQRYSKTPPEGRPSELLASQAAEKLEKKAEKRPKMLANMLRGAALSAMISGLVQSPAFIANLARLRGQPAGPALATLLKHHARAAAPYTAAGAIGGAVAHPFAVKDWKKKQDSKAREKK